jgi:hypothetical protein
VQIAVYPDGEPIYEQTLLLRPVNESEKVFDLTLNVQTPQFGITGLVGANTDPFVAYSFGVINFTGAPLTFSFLFSSPFIGGPYPVLISNHSSSVTAGHSGPPPVTVTPAGVSGFVHTPMINGVPTTVGRHGDGCVVGTPPDPAAGPCDSGGGFFSITPVTGPGTLGVHVAFTLSPGDNYSTNGRVELTSVVIPEPTTMALGFTALLGLFLYRRVRA